MIDKKHIMEKYGNYIDRQVLSKVLDKARIYEKTHRPVHTDFLDDSLIDKIRDIFTGENISGFVSDGGYEDAVRKLIVFTDLPPKKIFPVLLKAEHQWVGQLSHRDYLGSITGLGIARDKIGDMVVGEDSGHIITLKEIGEYLYTNLTRIGNIKISLEYRDIGEASDAFSSAGNFITVNATVSSLRADNLICRGFGISRTGASEFFTSKKVFINGELITDKSRKVKEGDRISVRGKGKMVFSREGKRTKKDRIGISLIRYL